MTGNVLYKPMMEYMDRKATRSSFSSNSSSFYPPTYFSILLLPLLHLLLLLYLHLLHSTSVSQTVTRKTFTGFENSAVVRYATTLERPVVDMPSADQMYQLCNLKDEVEVGPLRLENFLVEARAQQIREKNKRSTHAKHLRARQAVGETIGAEKGFLGFPRTSTR